MSINAFLLSAGLGTRLKPITDSIPKCLVPLSGRPILQLWFKKLEQINCSSVLVNTHYLHTQVEEFIDSYKTTSRLNISTSFEDHLLGTAGSLIANLDFFDDSLSIVIHSDNFMYQSLSSAIQQHKINRPLMTMVTFTTSTPSSCGIVEVDSSGFVQSFHEKVPNPPSNTANGAIYIFDGELIKFLRQTLLNYDQVFDISRDIIPLLLGRIQVWHTDEMFADIGTLKSYMDASRFFAKHGIE